MTDEVIIGLDDHNNPYPLSKLRAHRENLRHRAISIFVFYQNCLLLQQRAAGKYHAGRQWSNSCCSHPHWQESVEECAKRRLRQELGFSAELERVVQIDYQTPVNSLYENEQVTWFLADLNSLPPLDRFDRDEVQALRWSTVGALQDDIKHQPNQFTPWFRLYLEQHRDAFDRMDCMRR